MRSGRLTVVIRFLSPALPGCRTGCCRHCDGLLLLLPGSQEFQNYGLLQKYGAPGRLENMKLPSTASDCWFI